MVLRLAICNKVVLFGRTGDGLGTGLLLNEVLDGVELRELRVVVVDGGRWMVGGGWWTGALV